MCNQDGGRDWRYETAIAHETADNSKIDHFARNLETGEVITIDFTPYRMIEPPVFGALAAMGFPRSPGLGPWRPDEVLAAATAQGVAHD